MRGESAAVYVVLGVGLVATSILLAEPVGATALAALVLDERPSLLECAGALLVLAGVYLALTRGSKN